jgi:hypothetical protein
MHEEEPGKIKPIGDGVVRRGILFTLDGTSENPEDIAEFELE